MNEIELEIRKQGQQIMLMEKMAMAMKAQGKTDAMLEQLERLTPYATVPLIAKPNAGMPVISDTGEAIYPMTPEEFAENMQVLVQAGADIIGGCCGTNPDFIAALRCKIG